MPKPNKKWRKHNDKSATWKAEEAIPSLDPKRLAELNVKSVGNLKINPALLSTQKERIKTVPKSPEKEIKKVETNSSKKLQILKNNRQEKLQPKKSIKENVDLSFNLRKVKDFIQQNKEVLNEKERNDTSQNTEEKNVFIQGEYVEDYSHNSKDQNDYMNTEYFGQYGHHGFNQEGYIENYGQLSNNLYDLNSEPDIYIDGANWHYYPPDHWTDFVPPNTSWVEYPNVENPYKSIENPYKNIEYSKEKSTIKSNKKSTSMKTVAPYVTHILSSQLDSMLSSVIQMLNHIYHNNTLNLLPDKLIENIETGKTPLPTNIEINETVWPFKITCNKTNLNKIKPYVTGINEVVRWAKRGDLAMIIVVPFVNSGTRLAIDKVLTNLVELGVFVPVVFGLNMADLSRLVYDSKKNEKGENI